MPATYIQTFTGDTVDFVQVLRGERTQPFDLRDIAHGLAGINRWASQGQRWSVLQHTLLGARLLAELDADGRAIGGHQLPQIVRAPAGRTPCEERMMALDWLLHDAHEAFVGDLTTPLKALIRSFTHVYDDLVLAFDQVIYRDHFLDPITYRSERQRPCVVGSRALLSVLPLRHYVDSVLCREIERAWVFEGRQCDRPWGTPELGLQLIRDLGLRPSDFPNDEACLIRAIEACAGQRAA